MREYRVILAGVLLLLLFVAGELVYRSMAADAGTFDELAYARIGATCGYKPECKVKLGDLYDGQWDTFWEFSSAVSEAEVQRAVPGILWRPRGPSRLVVLTGGGEIWEKLPEAGQPGGEGDHQLCFRGDPAVVRLSRDTWMWATRRANSHGTYYLMSPDDR